MANPGQPTIGPGDTGDVVKRAQRALRRTPDLGLAVDGVFGPATEQAVKEFQQGSGLTADGIVGPLTWAALPDGGPMPVAAARLDRRRRREPADDPDQRRERVGHWPRRDRRRLRAARRKPRSSLSSVGRRCGDGIVGDQTWAVSLHALSATLESAVGLEYVIG